MPTNNQSRKLIAFEKKKMIIFAIIIEKEPFALANMRISF